MEDVMARNVLFCLVLLLGACALAPVLNAQIVYQLPGLTGDSAAVGDFNNDGGVDVLISLNNGPPVLLRNCVGSRNHWLGLCLVGTKGNRDAVGARISYQAGDLKRSRMKVGGGSFLSSHDPRVVLGIGDRIKLDWIEIKWPLPSKAVERFTDLPIDRYITIVEGEGKWK